MCSTQHHYNILHNAPLNQNNQDHNCVHTVLVFGSKLVIYLVSSSWVLTHPGLGPDFVFSQTQWRHVNVPSVTRGIQNRQYTMKTGVRLLLKHLVARTGVGSGGLWDWASPQLWAVNTRLLCKTHSVHLIKRGQWRDPPHKYWKQSEKKQYEVGRSPWLFYDTALPRHKDTRHKCLLCERVKPIYEMLFGSFWQISHCLDKNIMTSLMRQMTTICYHSQIA